MTHTRTSPLSRFLTAAAWIVFLHQSAAAVSVVTPALEIGDGSARNPYCEVISLNGTTVSVTLNLRNGAGTIITSTPCSLNTGDDCDAGVAFGTTGVFYCEAVASSAADADGLRLSFFPAKRRIERRDGGEGRPRRGREQSAPRDTPAPVRRVRRPVCVPRGEHGFEPGRDDHAFRHLRRLRVTVLQRGVDAVGRCDARYQRSVLHGPEQRLQQQQPPDVALRPGGVERELDGRGRSAIGDGRRRASTSRRARRRPRVPARVGHHAAAVRRPSG